MEKNILEGSLLKIYPNNLQDAYWKDIWPIIQENLKNSKE